jgi:hypothetical protein
MLKALEEKRLKKKQDSEKDCGDFPNPSEIPRPPIMTAIRGRVTSPREK